MLQDELTVNLSTVLILKLSSFRLNGVIAQGVGFGMSVVRTTIMGSAGTLLGIAIALAILAVVAGLSILGAGTSAGLNSAITEINSFLVLIGLGTAVGLVIKALSLTGA
jgi:hypothetical protein